jgi:hypothetical protein
LKLKLKTVFLTERKKYFSKKMKNEKLFSLKNTVFNRSFQGREKISKKRGNLEGIGGV